MEAKKCESKASFVTGGVTRFMPVGVIFLVLVLVNTPSAASPPSTSPQYFCDSVINPSSTLLGQSAGVGPFNAMILVSLLILLMMLNISAISYLLGSTFRIDKLANFGKTEIGEVAVTLIVVLLTLGTFTVINTASYTGSSGTYQTVPGNFLALSGGTLNPDIFYGDCVTLAGASLNTLGNMVSVFAANRVTSIWSAYNYGVTISEEGLNTVKPLAGLSLSQIMLAKLADLGFGLMVVPLGVAMVLGVFFALFPIFLYLGIILRTLPWTRAIGGAFLGLFIGFYVVFPLLIFLMGSQVNVSTINYSDGGAGSSGLSPSIGFQLPNQSAFGFGIVVIFFHNVVSQMAYLVFVIILSFIIAYDFMEYASDFLGAPSLSSLQALKKII